MSSIERKSPNAERVRIDMMSMQNCVKYLLQSILTIVIFGAVACQSVDEGAAAAEASSSQTSSQSGGAVLYASTSSDDTTKIAFTDNDTEGITLVWEVGDEFALYDSNSDFVDDFVCTSVDDGKFESTNDETTLIDGVTYTATYSSADGVDTQSGNEINDLDDACYMSATFEYSDGLSFTFEHQMAIMTFKFTSSVTPAKLTFKNGDENLYTVNFSDTFTADDDGLYTSHIMINPCEQTPDGRTLTFTLYNSAGTAYDIRTATSTKAYVKGYRYTATLTSLDPTIWLGSGTSSDPYQITTSEQLSLLATNVNAGTKYLGNYFMMTKDINLGGSESPWTPIGSSDSKCFSGTFDGGGYTISGLYINTSSDTYSGLFGYTSGAIIRYLGVSGDVTSTKSSGYVGGIVGYNDSSSTITSCYNAVSVSGSSSVGGIVGGNKAAITTCYNVANITGGYNQGGIAGKNMSGGAITSCYNVGAVTGGTYKGGIAGANTETISYSYSINTVVTSVAGSGSGSTNSCECLSSDDMLDSGFISNLNSSVWKSDYTDTPINGGYPILSWQ